MKVSQLPLRSDTPTYRPNIQTNTPNREPMWNYMELNGQNCVYIGSAGAVIPGAVCIGDVSVPTDACGRW